MHASPCCSPTVPAAWMQSAALLHRKTDQRTSEHSSWREDTWSGSDRVAGVGKSTPRSSARTAFSWHRSPKILSLWEMREVGERGMRGELWQLLQEHFQGQLVTKLQPALVAGVHVGHCFSHMQIKQLCQDWCCCSCRPSWKLRTAGRVRGWDVAEASQQEASVRICTSF